MGRQIWKMVTEEAYNVGVVDLGPATGGLRVAKSNPGNVPARMVNSNDSGTPVNGMAQPFFWKKS